MPAATLVFVEGDERLAKPKPALASERFVDDRQSPEAGHEDIDIDAWADRIKAEDKVNVE